ncbi:winged helix-turn-helix domain-containing protein [Planctomycetota bacterium]
MSKHTQEARSKVWLEVDGQPVFGQGLALLIAAISETGSLQEAARGLKMSYRNAWEKINKAEARLGRRLILRQAGGSCGGGSELTPDGYNFLGMYKQLCEDVDAFTASRFRALCQEQERVST